MSSECTCVVGRTLAVERLAALDEALRSGADSLGRLAKEYGLAKPSVGRHKLQCLGIEKSHEGRFVEAVRRPETARDDGQRDGDGPPRPRAESSKPREVAERETSHETEEPARIGAGVLASGLVDPAALGVAGFAAQVRHIADMLTTGQWKDRRSVKALCATWGLGRDAVHERHRAAAVLASTDRGAMAEQLENTIGLVTAGAEECEGEALKLEHPTNEAGEPIVPSEDARQLALKYRALGAKNRGVRMRLEGLIQTRVSISLEADPRIQGLWPVLWETLAELDAARARHLAAVEKLTGGTLPAEELPSATDMIEAAVRRYEERIGARAPKGLAA
jgi:hypothetical protein